MRDLQAIIEDNKIGKVQGTLMTDRTNNTPYRKYIYVVCEGLDYEGYNEPEAAFESEEDAEEFAAKIKSTMYKGGFIDVIKVELR